jgi:Ca2+-binding EF-hand superfamily protein
MKKKMVFLAVALVFGLVTSPAAFCGQSYHKKDGYHKGGGMALTQELSDLDTDGNGSLSFEEFKSAFPSMDQKAFDFLDTDKDGMLDHDEWQRSKEMHKGMGGMQGKKESHAKGMPDPSGFNAHFPDMDSDKDGQVTLGEFNAYFPDASEAAKAFNAIDLDGNGALDHDEWHEFKKAHGMKHVE